jgi:integrase
MKAARAVAAEFLAPINGGRRTIGPVTVAELVARYIREELPERPSTRAAYSSLLTRHIEPRWGDVLLSEVRASDVETWLKGLDLAPKTKANVRQLMHVLWECARRWEMADSNPITLVRQSAKRSRELARLSVVQYRALCGAMLEPHRTMVLIAGCLGLRIGEILGLQWGDVDFEAATLTVARDVYQGQIDAVKTGNSARVLPVPAGVLESLKVWRANASYQANCEFVFSQDNGRPMWADTLRERVLQPTAASLGIGKIGWHAFRHLFATVLQVVGAEGVVAKELMGHADESTTAQYRYALADRKRAATDSVASLLSVQ